MLSRTRRGRAPDTGRMGQALSRAGIDPRTWVSLAVVQAVGVRDDGVYVDVMLIPSGMEEHARVGAAYSGSGFGLYAPMDVGDEVVVAAPGGDNDVGLVVVGRLWSPADAPPADAVENPADVILLAKDGATVRVAVQGSGNVVLDPRGDGKVLLGGETDTAPVARVGDEVEISLAQWAAATPTNGGGTVSIAHPMRCTIVTGAAKTEAK